LFSSTESFDPKGICEATTGKRKNQKKTHGRKGELNKKLPCSSILEMLRYARKQEANIVNKPLKNQERLNPLNLILHIGGTVQ
jgi:hypothetical protein